MENVDLDLLPLFPQKGARIIGGEESKQAQRGQQWGEELAQNRWRQRRKKTPFYSLPRIHPLEPVGSPPTTVVPCLERYYRAAVLPQWIRYYRAAVVPQSSAVPTTARDRALAVVVTVLGCGSTVARYYRARCGTTVLR